MPKDLNHAQRLAAQHGTGDVQVTVTAADAARMEEDMKRLGLKRVGGKFVGTVPQNKLEELLRRPGVDDVDIPTPRDRRSLSARDL